MSMPRGPHQTMPPVSCFSGITVCIKTISTSTIKAPRQLPVKLIVKHKEIGPADVGFTVIVQPVTMEQVGVKRQAVGVDQPGWHAHGAGRCETAGGTWCGLSAGVAYASGTGGLGDSGEA